jgi:hypothetical protein
LTRKHSQGVGGVQVGNQLGDFDSSVIDQDVEATYHRDSFLDGDCPVVVVGHVQVDERCLGSGVRERLRTCGALLVKQIGDHH